MRKHRKSATKVLLATIALTATMGLTAYAGQWQQDTTGWWYEQDNACATGWQWIDGKSYYFDDNGYLLSNTTTPDGYQVDASGAWIVNGVVQIQAAEADSVLNSESAKFFGTWVYDYSTTGFGLPGTIEWRLDTYDGAREGATAHCHLAKFTFYEQNGNVYVYYNDIADSKKLISMDNGMLRYNYTYEIFNYSQYFHIGNNGALMLHSTDPNGYFIINEGDKSGTYFLHFYKKS